MRCMHTSMHECTVQCILLYCRHMHTYAGLSEWACVSWIWQSGENQVLSLHISGTSDHTISVYCKRFPPRVSETNWALRSTGQMPFHLNAPPGWIPIQRVPSDNLIQRCWFTKLWEIYKAHNTLKPIPKKSKVQTALGGPRKVITQHRVFNEKAKQTLELQILTTLW